MTENKTIKKMVLGILRGRKNSSFDRNIMHPEREWFLGMLLGVIVFSVGIAWNVSTHLKFKNVSASDATQVEEKIVYRASLVEEALSDFAERERKYEELKESLLMRQVSIPVDTSVITKTEDSPEIEVPEILDQTDVTEISPTVPVDPDAFISPAG